MRIGGLQKFSLIDFPGKVSCIIFTQGCNFRCGYCHNPQLVVPEQFCPDISEETVFSFLESRKNYLQGVVVSGGEPTLHADLEDFLGKIKKVGLLIKLDTNGSQPDRLRRIMTQGLVDYIAMDVKAPLPRYNDIIGARIDPNRIQESIDLIIHSGIRYEFRTTVVKSVCQNNGLPVIQQMIRGTQAYRLQKAEFNDRVLNKELAPHEQLSSCEFSQLIRQSPLRPAADCPPVC